MSRHDLLRHIIAVSERIRDVVPSPTSSKSTSAVDIPSLQLTKATSNFHAQLQRHAFLPSISRIVSSKATQLAKIYQTSYEVTCRNILSIPRSKESRPVVEVLANLRRTFEFMYENKDLPKFLASAVDAQSSYQGNLCTSSASECRLRPSFNHVRLLHCIIIAFIYTIIKEYTPLLEKYFEKNAYPSSKDRLLLAQKSGMTPRQIEVWVCETLTNDFAILMSAQFQNHRRRAKHDGKILKRWTSAHPVCLDLAVNTINRPNVMQKGDNSIRGNSVKFEVPHREDVSTLISAFRVKILILFLKLKQSTAFTTNILESPAPPHAYPTKYTPTGPFDPFPMVNGHFVFSPPHWLRKPTTQSDKRLSPTDIDELATMFANKLNIRDSLTNRTNGHKTKKKAATPWFAATHTVPCPAPLPALIRSTNVPMFHSRTNFQTIFGASSALESHTMPTSCFRTRKTSAFPKRMPIRLVSSDSHEGSSSHTTPTSGQSRSSSSSSFSSLCPSTPPSDSHHVITHQDMQVFGDLLACHSEQHITPPFFFDDADISTTAPYLQPDVHIQLSGQFPFTDMNSLYTCLQV